MTKINAEISKNFYLTYKMHKNHAVFIHFFYLTYILHKKFSTC